MRVFSDAHDLLHQLAEAASSTAIDLSAYQFLSGDEPSHKRKSVLCAGEADPCFMLAALLEPFQRYAAPEEKEYDLGMDLAPGIGNSGGGGGLTPNATTGERRYSLYSPELNLIAESELTTSSPPLVAYEYIWFAGQPVAQVDVASNAVHWTFTDHLGTPLLQTDAAGAVHWRAEYEPYGRIFALRTGDQHQPLRFPGQEAEQRNLGANGATERSYNIFRWYRGGWGRYSQSDPIGLKGGANLFAYAASNPLKFTDSLGLFCAKKDWVGHYYFGKGKTLNLADVGLLDDFVATKNIQSDMKGERAAANNAARDFAKNMCKGCSKGVKAAYMNLSPYKSYSNFESVPCFFSIGSTFIGMEETNCMVTANCDTNKFRYNCASKWALNDHFSDPLALGIEVGGVPYDIVANWFDLFEGGGAF